MFETTRRFGQAASNGESNRSSDIDRIASAGAARDRNSSGVRLPPPSHTSTSATSRSRSVASPTRPRVTKMRVMPVPLVEPSRLGRERVAGHLRRDAPQRLAGRDVQSGQIRVAERAVTWAEHGDDAELGAVRLEHPDAAGAGDVHPTVAVDLHP